VTWQNSFRESFKDVHSLSAFLNIKAIDKTNYKVFVPKSFAQRIKESGKTSPLWKQFVPSYNEQSSEGLVDPIGDVKKSKGSGIIHRYESRILFTPTTVCPIICRYCFRKNELSSNDKIFNQNLEGLKQYLQDNPKINEVILTGGDPLILSEDKLKKITNLLIASNIYFLRFHTRTPIILPDRINDAFIDYINSITPHFKKIIFVLHTNHSSEIDDKVIKALNKLRECRIDKKVQSVLLKGVNNTVESLIELFYKVIDCDFTPYYLHHPDRVKGAMHFYLTLEEGRSIYIKLRDKLPGWAIPHYIIDHPTGSGKQNAFNPEQIEFSGKLLDKSGNLQEYMPSN
jgi:lysine 2,3-aminomutase